MSKLGEPMEVQTEEVLGSLRSSRDVHKQETTKDADGSRRRSARKTKDDMDQQRAKMSTQQKIIDSTARKEKARKKKQGGKGSRVLPRTYSFGWGWAGS